MGDCGMNSFHSGQISVAAAFVTLQTSYRVHFHKRHILFDQLSYWLLPQYQVDSVSPLLTASQERFYSTESVKLCSVILSRNIFSWVPAYRFSPISIHINFRCQRSVLRFCKRCNKWSRPSVLSTQREVLIFVCNEVAPDSRAHSISVHFYKTWKEGETSWSKTL
jgi:hypothetical protein